MKLFVNFLSCFRVLAAFAIIPALLFQHYWCALILFVLAALSDWFDGFLARKYDVCTKLGGVIDSTGDKLLVANTLIMLSVMMPVWFIVVPTVLLIARELYVSGLREFLGTQKMEMPVPNYRFAPGKIKATLQMITISAFLALFAFSSFITPANISKTYLIIMNTLSQIGIIGIWASVAFSLWSATKYTITFSEKIKKIKK